MDIFFSDRLNGKEHSVFTGVAIIHCRSKGMRRFIMTQYLY